MRERCFCALVGADGRIFTSTDPFAAKPPASTPGKDKGKGSGRRLVKRPATMLLKADRFPERTRYHRLKVHFRFYAKAKARIRGFVCKRDRDRYRPCRSPLRYSVPIGRHVLRVRAIGFTGLRGPVAKIDFQAIHNPAFDRTPARRGR